MREWLQCDRCKAILSERRLDDDPECRVPSLPPVRFCHPDAAEPKEDPPEFEFRCPKCHNCTSFSVIEAPCERCVLKEQELCDGLLHWRDACCDRIATDDAGGPGREAADGSPE